VSPFVTNCTCLPPFTIILLKKSNSSNTAEAFSHKIQKALKNEEIYRSSFILTTV